jgi:Putative peptidoglycan binding domain
MMTKLVQISLCLALPFAALAQSSDMPSNGTPGKCYAKCLIPDQYSTTTDQVETRAAYSGTDAVAPNFQTVNRSFMVKAVGSKLMPTAPVMETITEKVMIKPEGKKMVLVAAQYETYTERVEVRPASKRTYTVPGQYETVTDQQIYLGTGSGISTGKGTGAGGFSPSDLQSVGDALSRDGGADDASGVNGGRGRRLDPNSPNNPSRPSSPANPNGKNKGKNPNGKPNDPNSPNKGGNGNGTGTGTGSGNGDGNGDGSGNGDGNGNGTGSGNGTYTYSNSGMVVDGSSASELSMVGTIMPYVVKSASIRVDRMPAQYETMSEQILVSPASTKWEKKVADRNCLSADPNDCSVWCLIAVPAQYKTVTKQVAKACAEGYVRSTGGGDASAANGGGASKEECIKIVQVGAEYGARQIVKVAPSVREEVIPAEYKTITMQRIVKPASVVEEIIPAEYATITKQVVKSGGGYVRQTEPASYKTVSISTRSGLQLKPGYRWTTSGLMYNPSYTGSGTGSGMMPGDPSTGNGTGTGTNPDGSPKNPNGTSPNGTSPNGTSPNGKAPNGGTGNGAGARPGSGNGNGAGPGGNGGGNGGDMMAGDVPADPYSADPYTNWDNAGCPSGYAYDVASSSCTKSVNIPAQVTSVTKKTLTSKGGFSEWREVVCAANVTSAVIREVQAALRAKGYDPGASDNVLGAQTKSALTKFQKDNGLPVGSMDLETLKALGVKY